ncbi:MAG: TonB-dependent receptor [Pseudomonadota bacterium]|jgi:iron complex outermembrane receptor protein
MRLLLPTRVAGATRALMPALMVSSAAVAATQEAVLEEIVVTAERRETALQDTPISIIALSAEALEQKGVEDLQDMALFTPNLAIQGGRGAGDNAPSFIIRGVSGGGGTTSERGVALYIDGIYVPRTSGSVFKVFDLERVEVLRGPQGTLFGRNSTGGAVRLVTKQPEENFDAYVRVTGGNLDRRDVTGMVNVPLSETVLLRAQAAYLNEDGYVRRGSQKLGSSEDILGRVQLAISPREELKVTLGALYSNSRSDGSPVDFESFDMSPDLDFEGNFADWLSDALEEAGQPRLEVVDDPRIVLDDFTMPDFCFIDDWDPDWDDACKLRNDNRYYQLDANVSYRLGRNTTFTSISGFARLKHVGNTDWQALGFEFRPDDVKSKVFYQEFQLNTSLFGGKVDLVTGLNYFREKSRSHLWQDTRRGTSVFTPTGGSANGNTDAGIFRTAHAATTQVSDSFGWFNSATWHATDRFNITAGARLTYDRKDYEQTRFAASDFTPAPGTTSTTVDSDHDWDQVDWRLTLDYHFTPDIMAYATASKAYKSGQYSFTVLPNVPGPDQSGDFISPIPPEKVVNYEAGLRMELLGGRLRLNPTAYMMKWTSRQAARQVNCSAEGPEACPVGFRILVVDSGDVDVWGYELDAQLALSRNLVLDGALGITKDDVKDPVANSGPNLFPDQASPTWNIGATWNQPTPSGSSWSFNINYAYSGEQETHPTSGTDSSYRLPDYALMNARLQWRSADGRNLVTLFGNNLLDKVYATYATRFGGGFWDNGPGTGVGAPPRSALSVVRGKPRSWGITLQHNF